MQKAEAPTMNKQSINRRSFIQRTSLIGAGSTMLATAAFAGNADNENINHIGPKEGFTPLIGTLVSQLDWLSDTVFRYNKTLTGEQLDVVFDEDSNSIGALIMHLAATEVIYQDMTFYGLNGFSPANKEKWEVAMNLGKPAQEQINGHDLAWYKKEWDAVRAVTKTELRKRDDNWLLGGATKEADWNNFCKWFHVAEHIANHRGQMTWYAKRILA